LPLVLLARQGRRRAAGELSPYAGPLALMLGVNMIDMLPNATLIPFTWLLAGALLGYAEALAANRPAGAPQPAVPEAVPAGVRPVPPRTIL
jgi:hypothetical protein